jgi:hypothetical protein
MNIVDDRPDDTGRVKVLLLVGVVWLYAILVGSYWWAMVAIRDNHLGPPAAFACSAVYTVLILGTAFGFIRLWRGAVGGSTPALRRRDRRTMVSAAIYAALLLAVAWLQRLHPVHGVLAYALALLPAIPVVAMAVAMGLYFREETDEFERTVRVENALWATGGTLAIATVWGFAEMLAQAPHAGAWVWFPLWAAFTSVADIFTRRRYR